MGGNVHQTPMAESQTLIIFRLRGPLSFALSLVAGSDVCDIIRPAFVLNVVLRW